MKDSFFINQNASAKESARLLEKGRNSLLFLQDIFNLPFEVQAKIFVGIHDSCTIQDLEETRQHMVNHITNSGNREEEGCLLAAPKKEKHQKSQSRLKILEALEAKQVKANQEAQEKSHH